MEMTIKFLISYAKSNEQGNKNIKIDDETVRIKDLFSKKWLEFKHDFGGRFIKAESILLRLRLEMVNLLNI